MKAFAVGLAAPVVLFALILGVAVMGATGTSANAAGAPALEICLTTGPIRGLDSVAAANARIVAATAERSVGSQGAAIAVMVGMTESGLHVLGNPAVAGSGTNEGSGTNYDSIGIFQQRASWGTVPQRLDPQMSTQLFTARLAAVKDWQREIAWEAAQQVQRSAFDGRPRAANDFDGLVGDNYRRNATRAQSIVQLIDGQAAKASCSAMHGGVPASIAPGSRGLPSSYTVPPNASAAAREVISYALAQLDKPYVFGAAGPSAFDCSGLTLAAWAQAGVALPHQAAAQSQLGTPTSVDRLLPGDLIFVPGDDGTLAAPGHVGIYLGVGLVVNAADERIGIRVQTYDNFVSVGHGLAALRHFS